LNIFGSEIEAIYSFFLKKMNDYIHKMKYISVQSENDSKIGQKNPDVLKSFEIVQLFNEI
jgi:hypothetical protein